MTNLAHVDPVLEDDIETGWDSGAEAEPAPSAELMDTGILLKSEALRNALRDASESEIDSELERWLIADD